MGVRWLHILAVSTAAIVIAPQIAISAGGILWKINRRAALHLIGQAIGVAYEQWLNPDIDNDRFFVFDGLNKPPADGSFGFFAVNRWTGDVWALWGCHRLTSPALRRAQVEIRRRFTRSELKEYVRLHSLKPECIIED